MSTNSFLNSVKWFQVLLWITNNSFKHQSLVYTISNDQKGGGARGVIVIVAGNGHVDTSSNPGRD